MQLNHILVLELFLIKNETEISAKNQCTPKLFFFSDTEKQSFDV